MKIATSSTFAITALSKPFSFGVKAVYLTPFILEIPLKTSPASESWGTHLGLTKLEVSIFLKPQKDSLLINLILSLVEMKFFSFCKPSLGLISKIFIKLSII